ncbi:D-alanyl-D-alanine carboxypeptidase family protein [Pseudobutyrivibrio xylanivorans]|uniref:D-alanyl-D-alanine carboxypeptidase (Penicillin-binding protein 5/6) n=1 Tax=Pseudobutyrivibrio xylanivorans TaxID=185007 RepID=A0A1G5RVB6_PSEXY|nr:serine hydrolase [Pseudobutyrivibrio xylanivorans]SCZ77391.1 D-alanyl-D-alanine carboxypeptidase (penicillin-binding protein 5/6) [Pseudobutyrivibrio xylanivorans]
MSNNFKNRNMSSEERREYRRRKKMIRRIQVYSEMALIIIGLIVTACLIISHIKGKDDNSLKVAAEEQVVAEAEAQEEKATGLKVSAKASEEPKEEETKEIEEEEAPKAGNYSAKESEETVQIGGDVVSESAVLINNKTKTIVATRNATEKIVPASMTKVMTVLVAANHIPADKLNDKVVMSHEAIDYSYAGGGSTSGFVEDEEVTVKDLFYGTILPSGGDAAAQLAIYVAGDIDSFVKMMNEECASLGINGTTHFTNPVGFHSKEHYSTPYDIAVIMMAALDNELCKEVITTKVYNSTATNVNPEGITISNWFLRRIEDKEFGGEIEGAKTGYVDESGSCAVSSMISESGTEYICCTAHSSSSWRCIYDHVDIYKSYAK